MAALSDLPVELLEFIIDNVNFTDIENFAASSRLFAELAKTKRHLHHQRKKQYSELNFSMDIHAAMDPTPEKNPLLLLQNICNDDSLRLYPRRLNLDNFHLMPFRPRHHQPQHPDPHSAITRPRRTLGSTLIKHHEHSLIAKLFPYLGKLQTKVLIQSVHFGNYVSCVCILLVLLSKIEQVHVRARDDESVALDNMVRDAGFCHFAGRGEVVATPQHHPSAEQHGRAMENFARRCRGAICLHEELVDSLFHNLMTETRLRSMRCLKVLWGKRSLSFVPYDKHLGFDLLHSGFSKPPSSDYFSVYFSSNDELDSLRRVRYDSWHNFYRFWLLTAREQGKKVMEKLLDRYLVYFGLLLSGQILLSLAVLYDSMYGKGDVAWRFTTGNLVLGLLSVTISSKRTISRRR